MVAQYQVKIIESERGWGSKVDEVINFNSLKEANDFVSNYNKQNNKDYVPDIYWRAEKPTLVDLDV